jgi:hypothetical protein
MIVFVLTDLARDLSRHSYVGPFDLGNDDEGDDAAEEFPQSLH